MTSGVINDDEVSGFGRATSKGTHTFKLILLGGIALLLVLGAVGAAVVLLGGGSEPATTGTPAASPTAPQSSGGPTPAPTVPPSGGPTPAPTVPPSGGPTGTAPPPPVASASPSAVSPSSPTVPVDGPVITEADVTPEAGQAIVSEIVTWVEANRTPEGNAPDNVAFGRAVLDGSVNPAYGWKNDYRPNGADFCVQLTLFNDDSLTVAYNSTTDSAPTVGATCPRPN